VFALVAAVGTLTLGAGVHRGERLHGNRLLEQLQHLPGKVTQVLVWTDGDLINKVVTKKGQ